MVFALALFFMFSGVGVFAEGTQEYVNVGLESKFKNLSSVKIVNNNITISLGKHQVDLKSNSGFSITPQGKYYLKSSAFKNFSEAKSSLGNFAQGSKIAFIDNNFYICGGPYASEAEAKNNLKSNLSVLSLNSNLLEISGSNENILFDSSLDTKISDTNGSLLNIGDKSYRGAFRFSLSSGKITVVNYVSIEEYLYSVVPSEMPPSWHEEALKAQAVAARSYLLTRVGIHSKSGYDLCDTTHCQAYNGAKSENARTTEAVKATENIIAYYDNKPINAVFSSSSGGITDNSENSWSSGVPYLKSVLELNEDSKIWTRTFSMNEITILLNNTNSKIGTATGISIGSIKNERVYELIIHGTNGKKILKGEEIRTFFSSSKDGSLFSRYFRINEEVPAIQKNETQDLPQNNQKSEEIYIYNGQNVKSENKDMFVYYDGKAQKLNSNFSVIDKFNKVFSNSLSISNTYTPSGSGSVGTIYSGQITLNGRGWGHGVGMSQYGAKGMAELGYKYDQILKHYFTGIEVK